MIRLVFGGDFCPIHRATQWDSHDRFAYLTSELRTELGDLDAFIVNLECPLTSSDQKSNKIGPNLKALPNSVIWLKELGINIVALANNHILDYGSQGLKDTQAVLCDNDIKYCGAGDNLKEARKSLIFNIGVKRIGIANFAENEYASAADNRAGANPLNLVDNYSDLVDLIKTTDYAFVYIHGGNEHYHLPPPFLVKICHFFTELGAAAVFVSHSHHPSGYELYRGKPIFYGLGNFIFDWPDPVRPMWRQGYLVLLEIQEDLEFSIKPFLQFEDPVIGLRFLSEFQKDAFHAKLSELSKIIQDERKLSTEWDLYVGSHLDEVYANLLQFSPIKKKIHKWLGFLPSRKNKIRLMSLLNVIRCESHYHLLRDGLGQIVDQYINA